MKKWIEAFARRQLKEWAKHNHKLRTMSSVVEAKKAGLLYPSPEYAREAGDMVSWLEKRHISVVSLGYVHQKELGEAYTPNYKSDFFCKRHLGRWNLPRKDEINRFTGEEFDYLICLIRKPVLPLLGVSARSAAVFRIGPYLNGYTMCFDLMFDTRTEGIEAYIEEVKKYIEQYGQ